MMLQKAPPIPDVPVTITPLSGSGADKTSKIIDCTLGAAYWTVPFVSGDSRLVSTATADTIAVRIRDPALYSDAECTELVGYYRVNTKTIASSRRVTSSCPTYTFNTEICIAPKGYYAKLMCCRVGSNAFSSNDKFATYINNNASQALIRA